MSIGSICRSGARTSVRGGRGPGALCEALEARQLLAAVGWDGGGGDNLWHNPLNWTTDLVPGASDDVTIDVAANPAIQLTAVSGSRAVNSLVLRENLTISGGVSLTVGTTASIQGGVTLALAGGRLVGGVWNVVSGALGMDGSISNRLVGLTFNGPIALSDTSDRVGFEGAVTVTGLVSVSGTSAEIGMGNGAVLTAEISFPGSTGGRRIGPTSAGSTYAFGAGTNIHGGAFVIGRSFGGVNNAGIGVLNQGRIAGEVAGQTITIDPGVFTNTGTISVGPGNVGIIADDWSNATGTIEVTGGALNMGGTFDTGLGIGTWARLGGAVNVTGTVDNTGGVLTLNNDTGEWTLTGGTITGGTLTIAPGGALGMNSNAANRLGMLALNGNLLLGDASDRLSLGTGFTINGTITLSASGTELGLANGVTLNTEIFFPGSATSRRIGPTGGNGTYTLGPGANVHGNIFTIGRSYGGTTYTNVSVVSRAQIIAESGGQAITIDPDALTLTGTLAAAPGNIIVNAGTWTSGGIIVVTSGTFTIGGTLVTAGGIGNWSRIGGTVNVTGSIDNTGSVLNLGSTLGEWVLTGGQITGGTVNLSAGGGLGMTSDPTNRLSELTLNGDIVIAGPNDRLGLGMGVTINGVITVSGSSAELGLANGAVLNSEVVFPGGVAGRRLGPLAANTTFTLGPAANIHGGVFTIGRIFAGVPFVNTTIINQGLIAAETVNQTATLDPETLSSSGTLRTGPGSLSVNATSWSNTGVLDIGGGIFTIGGMLNAGGGIGTLFRTGGAVNITGTVNNTGHTLDLNFFTGEWVLTGGEIIGGTVNVLAGGALGMNSDPTNRLSALTFNGNVILADPNDRLSLGAGVTIHGVIGFLAVNTELGLADGAVLDTEVTFPGSIAGRKIGATGANVTYTLGPSALLHAGSFSLGRTYGGFAPAGVTVVNNGIISADSSGMAASVDAATFTNNGTVRALFGGTVTFAAGVAMTNVVAGTLTGGTWIADGPSALVMTGVAITTNATTVTIGGAGSFPSLATLALNSGTLLARGGGTFTITPAGGTFVNAGTLTVRAQNEISIAGAFAQSGAGSLTIQIQGSFATDVGKISATGAALLDGALAVTPINGYVPDCVTSAFLTAGSVVGQFATQSIPPPPMGHQTFVLYRSGEVKYVVSKLSDYNRDGALNSQDVFDFLIGFFNANADFNHDGATNSQDFFDFLANFFEPC